MSVFFTKDIIETIKALTKKPNQSYDDYISQVLGNPWAVMIKKCDLEDNMDIARLKELNQDDFERLQKYHKAYFRIINHKYE